MVTEHWWGYAALPDFLEQPYNGEENPMTPIVQFSLGDGMVYVFADIDYFLGDLEAESGHIGEWGSHLFKVLYTPTCDNLHEHEIRYADGTSAVPDAEPLDAPAKRGDQSFVLSKPTVWQDELEQDYPGYEVLVQLDENDKIGLRFYDCGTLFFLIKHEDLAARKFDNVKCVLYSY